MAASLEGLTLAQTADRIHFSYDTVKADRLEIRRKLGVTTWLQAVVIVVRHETVKEMNGGS